MKKLTFTLNALLIAIILFCTASMHGMDPTSLYELRRTGQQPTYHAIPNEQEQQALQADRNIVQLIIQAAGEQAQQLISARDNNGMTALMYAANGSSENRNTIIDDDENTMLNWRRNLGSVDFSS